MRKEFSGFRRKTKEVVSKIQFIETKRANMIAFMFEGNSDEKEKWKSLLIIYNANLKEELLKLPNGTWSIISDGITVFKHYVSTEGGRLFPVNPISVLILGEKKEENNAR